MPTARTAKHHGQCALMFALLASVLAACAPRHGFDDSRGNVAWREALLTAGVSPDKRIDDLSLDEAASVLAPCLSIMPTCADAVLATQPDLRGAALSPAWPYALREMPERFVPILLERGARADGAAVLAAMQRPREQGRQRSAVIRHLLAAGAEVEPVDFDGDRPLHLAADQADAELIELLLQHGADATRVNRDGLTALQLAEAQGDPRSIALLRKAMPRPRPLR